MTTCLTNLPHDIIFEVFSKKDILHVNDLVNLSRVNKSFSISTRPFIYKDVKTFHPSTSHLAQVELFARSIRENPQLALLPRTLHIGFRIQCQQQVTVIRRLLAGLTLLEKLSIYLPGSARGLRLEFVEENALQNLRCAKLEWPLTFQEVERYILLPRLETLSAVLFLGLGGDMRAGKLKAKDAVLPKGQQHQHVEPILKAFGISVVVECSEELDTLLAYCPGLESFTCGIDAPPGYPPSAPISPAKLAWVLTRRCHEALTTLNLETYDGAVIDGSSVADFSGLQRLKELK
ncbi:hypothetical protein FQN49_007495, partial [Arthroderma sp. PD_2]